MGHVHDRDRPHLRRSAEVVRDALDPGGLEAALATDRVLKEPRPYVLQKALDDFYARYELNAFTDEPTVKAKTYSELHQNIQDKLHEGGVEIQEKG